MPEQNSEAGSPTRPPIEPGLVRFTERLTDTPDPDEASREADMLLLFLAAGGTVLGTISGGILYLLLVSTRYAPTVPWMFWLLASVALGGICGCAIVMAALHAKQMIVWESGRR